MVSASTLARAALARRYQWGGALAAILAGALTVDRWPMRSDARAGAPGIVREQLASDGSIVATTIARGFERFTPHPDARRVRWRGVFRLYRNGRYRICAPDGELILVGPGRRQARACRDHGASKGHYTFVYTTDARGPHRLEISFWGQRSALVLGH